MAKHFLREIEKLKQSILSLSSRVESSLSYAVKAVHERDPKLADDVLLGDREIDALEVEVEEECLKILALHQPVAQDLRFIIAVLKINNDLERIGDLACNIAWRSKVLSGLPAVGLQFHILETASKVKLMVAEALKALIHHSPEQARKVCELDDEIDALHSATSKSVIEEIKKDPAKTEALLSLINVSRNLERIGDHATNIAEDVIYLVEGDIVRHGLGIRQ